MIQIGTAPQLTVRQAEQIEEEYRVDLKANMNSIRCYTTTEQRQEQRREDNKKYREANKDKIKAHVREVITCECGCEVTRSVLARHKKSQKHIELLSVKDIAVIT